MVTKLSPDVLSHVISFFSHNPHLISYFDSLLLLSPFLLPGSLTNMEMTSKWNETKRKNYFATASAIQSQLSWHTLNDPSADEMDDNKTHALKCNAPFGYCGWLGWCCFLTCHDIHSLNTHFHSAFLSQRGIQLLIQTGFIDLTVSPSLSTSTPSSGNTTCIAGGQGNTSQRTSTTSSSSSASANGSTSSASSSGQRTSSGVSTSSSTLSTTIANTTLASPPDVTHQELLASSVAHFLASRKGLSKQKIGEYLGNLQNPFNQLVLDFFVQEVDLSNLTIDEALRKYQTMFRFPGETQQIERLVEKFAARYVDCNPVLPRVRKQIPQLSSDSVGGDGEVVTFTCGGSNILSTSSTTSSTSSSSASSCMSSDCTSQGGSHLTKDEVFILSFAIIMLNTDLHVPHNKTRMTCAQWIKNLKGVFPGGDLSDSFLTDIYERIKCHELKTGLDHVLQVVMLQQQLLPGNTTATSQLPNLPIPDRRLVCFCRLYEVPDVNRKDRPGQHQREIFLFNDLLLVTKIVYNKNNRKSNNNSNNAYNISSQTTINNNHSHNGSSAIGSSNVNNENKQNVLSMSKQFYSYRGSYPLLGLVVKMFETTYYPYGMKIIRRLDDKVILTFNARNCHDRNRFVLDLKESIEEMHLTEASINFFKNNHWKSLPIVSSSVNLSHSSSSPLMNSWERKDAVPFWSSHSRHNIVNEEGKLSPKVYTQYMYITRRKTKSPIPFHTFVIRVFLYIFFLT